MKQQDLAATFQRITCFLLDMDGTIYLGDQLLDGTLEFLDALRATGRQAVFLTNNSSKCGASYVEKLQRMGITEPFLTVVTSGQATARYVLKAFPGQRPYLLGNDILKAEMLAMGVPVTNDNPDYVIIAFDTQLDYEKLTHVCDYVRTGLPYIATHPDFNCPTEDGFIPDIGATIAYIKASTGREPDLIVGKPYGTIVDDVLAQTDHKPEEMAMVGDRLYTDILTGLNHDIYSILVLTGETTQEMLDASDIKPDLVVDRLSSLIQWL